MKIHRYSQAPCGRIWHMLRDTIKAERHKLITSLTEYMQYKPKSPSLLFSSVLRVQARSTSGAAPRMSR